MPPATRFFDRLLDQFILTEELYRRSVQGELRAQLIASRGRLNEEERYRSYGMFKDIMLDPNTKRIIFDARQAQVFDDMHEEIPIEWKGKIFPPFSQFYLEFTEPILLSNQEPGFSDLTRAFIYRETDNLMCKIEGVELPLATLHMFCTEERFNRQYGERALAYVDRTWYVNMDLGIAITRAGLCRQNPDPSEIPDSWPDEGYVPSGMLLMGQRDRYIGWWERATADYTSLFMWMMTYMMAKSITLVEEPMSRQVRRWHERQKTLPKPWHVVKVEPKFYAAGKDPEAEGTGTQHSYRYDVIGHIRFGRHKTKDGYSETIEWVPPHQRGLQHSLYIPKTYKVDRDKQISPRMREYLPPPS